MIEIRFHGRGGQGSVTGAEILADAAFREGNMAFLRIDNKKITINSPIETPDCIIVLDQQLPKITNVVQGLKEGGIAVLNNTELPENVDLGVKLSKIATVDATGVSNELFGPRSIPITNTTMLAAFCKATGWVKLETLFEPIKERFGGRISEANIKAANLGYDRVKIKAF